MSSVIPTEARSSRSRYDLGMHAGAQQRRRARVPQVAKAVLGTSRAPRQTSGKRTQRHSTALAVTRRYFGPDSHAQEGTQRHFAVPANTLVDEFARRRSAVRTRCGPPAICRDFSSSPLRPNRRLQSFCNPNAWSWMARNGTGWDSLRRASPLGKLRRRHGLVMSGEPREPRYRVEDTPGSTRPTASSRPKSGSGTPTRRPLFGTTCASPRPRGRRRSPGSTR